MLESYAKGMGKKWRGIEIKLKDGEWDPLGIEV